jgi:hypothetical protein
MTSLFHTTNYLKQPSKQQIKLLKSIDDSLKSYPKQFWKYKSQFKEANADLIDAEIKVTLLNNSRDISKEL